MVTYLFYDTLCEEDEKDRIGGDAYLPGNINWPSHGNIPMLFLMTLSSNFLNKYANYEIPDSHCLSVFVPYAKGSIEGAIQLARTIDAATVLIHKTSSTCGLTWTSASVYQHLYCQDFDDDENDIPL